jgi:hypothetical protein
MQRPKRLPRGARPSPRSKLAAARPHVISGQASNNYIKIPKELSFWGNNYDGDCVTAEEAFAKACHNPEFFISQDTAIGWATEYGYLNGAFLSDVLETMQNKGFIQNERRYNDGLPYSVDWTNSAILTDAIYQGPVKIGVSADQLEAVWHKYNDPLPDPQNGWFATGFTKDTNEDHCVSLCGYGSIEWLAGQLGVRVPEGVNGAQPGYALFTWSTIGIIDVPSLLNITEEAWLRSPTTVGPLSLVQMQIGNNTTSSTPFVTSDGWVYFQGTDDKLWKVRSDGTQQSQIGGNTTAAMPYVVDGWVYFRGTDNKLWKVFNDGSKQLHIGDNTTLSTPFVTADGWVYFQGTDNKLWKVFNDGSKQLHIGDNTTSSMPYVVDGWVYFRGTDNKLWKVFDDGTKQSQIGGNTTSSMPFVTPNGWVYFRGTDNKLWKVFNDGTKQSQIGGNTTSSTPFVTADGWVYFQGTDNKLWKVSNDGSKQWWIGDNTTSSMPWVVNDWCYFRGTDNKLWVYPKA